MIHDLEDAARFKVSRQIKTDRLLEQLPQDQRRRRIRDQAGMLRRGERLTGCAAPPPKRGGSRGRVDGEVRFSRRVNLGSMCSSSR